MGCLFYQDFGLFYQDFGRVGALGLESVLGMHAVASMTMYHHPVRSRVLEWLDRHSSEAVLSVLVKSALKAEQQIDIRMTLVRTNLLGERRVPFLTRTLAEYERLGLKRRTWCARGGITNDVPPPRSK